MQKILKRTKIVATIGPVSSSPEMLTKLAEAGMNVIRLNMSHGDHAEHKARIVNARAVTKKTGMRIAVLQDLSGPKIRIGDFYQERVVIKKGDTFTLTTKSCVGDEKHAYVNYKKLPKEIKKGMAIMLDDGKKQLEVVSINGEEIVTKVIVGGELKGRRGVNVPGAYLSISSLTDKDREDAKFGISNKVDFMALSFVRRPSDVLELREILKKGKSDAAIISKIETLEAVDLIDEIIEVSDAIMVARGDLAIEVGAEHVPSIQKVIIQKCNAVGKPVITATQMLESMIQSPVPTRAEVSDIANAIFDGTDAVMLSEETTLGSYPIEAVSVMTKVSIRTEQEIGTHRRIRVHKNDIVDSVSSSVVHNAEDVHAQAILALTDSGFTARMISRYKPAQMVVVMTPHERVANKLVLSYGCYPALLEKFTTLEQFTTSARNYMTKEKIAKKGERIVIAGSFPFGKTGETNMMLVYTM